jgi:hypothetical protein
MHTHSLYVSKPIYCSLLLFNLEQVLTRNQYAHLADKEVGGALKLWFKNARDTRYAKRTSDVHEVSMVILTASLINHKLNKKHLCMRKSAV